MVQSAQVDSLRNTKWAAVNSKYPGCREFSSMRMTSKRVKSRKEGKYVRDNVQMVKTEHKSENKEEDEV